MGFHVLSPLSSDLFCVGLQVWGSTWCPRCHVTCSSGPSSSRPPPSTPGLSSPNREEAAAKRAIVTSRIFYFIIEFFRRRHINYPLPLRFLFLSTSLLKRKETVAAYIFKLCNDQHHHKSSTLFILLVVTKVLLIHIYLYVAGSSWYSSVHWSR